MDSAAAATTIRDFKPFRHLSDTSWALLSRGLRYKSHIGTTPVLRKGQKISGSYVVLSGQLRVYSLSPDGHEATLYLIKPGETCILALNCIFNDLLYPAWVEAAPATRVAVIPGAIYRVLFESEPAIRDVTIQAFSTIVFRLMAELEEVHTCALDVRLANFLLRHATSSGQLRMTQREIAAHLGCTREVIARVIGQLTADGHLLTGRKLITLRDPPRLAALVGRPRLRTAKPVPRRSS